MSYDSDASESPFPDERTRYAHAEQQRSRNSRNSLFSLSVNTRNKRKSPALPRFLWGLLFVSPLLVCAIIFFIVMFSIYHTSITPRMPPEDYLSFTIELVIVGGVVVGSVVIALLLAWGVKFRLALGGAGVGLFVALMIVFEYFIASSNTIYAMPVHLEITRAGFSPTVMSISASDQLRLSNTSDDIPQTLYVSSATSAQGTPDQLLRPGLTLQPGQSVNVAFSQEGTFTITSAGNSAMTVTITVGPGDSGSPDTPSFDSGMVPSQTVSY